MKTAGIIALVILGIVFLVAFSIFGRGCDTASQMADKTIFNADKNVWTYEQFHKQYETYKQYREQLKTAETKLAALEEKGITSGQNYDNLSMEVNGVRQMMRRIASDYNTMSNIAYQKLWKSKGLPETLGEE